MLDGMRHLRAPGAICFYRIYVTCIRRTCVCRTNANIKKRPGAGAPNRQAGTKKPVSRKKRRHGARRAGSRLSLFFHKELIQPHAGFDPDLFIDGRNMPLAGAAGDIQALCDLLDTLLGADEPGKHLPFPGGKLVLLRKGGFMGFPGGRLTGRLAGQGAVAAAVGQRPDHRQQRRHQ